MVKRSAPLLCWQSCLEAVPRIRGKRSPSSASAWGGRCKMPVGLFFLTLWDVPAVAPYPPSPAPARRSPLMPLCSELLQTAWEGGSGRAVITPFCSSLVLQPLWSDFTTQPRRQEPHAHTHTVEFSLPSSSALGALWEGGSGRGGTRKRDEWRL